MKDRRLKLGLALWTLNFIIYAYNISKGADGLFNITVLTVSGVAIILIVHLLQGK